MPSTSHLLITLFHDFFLVKKVTSGYIVD